MLISKIISGGQTGADRAALDVAIEFGIPHGGWIPKGRKTERGLEEPDALIAQVRICGGRGKVTSLVYPTNAWPLSR